MLPLEGSSSWKVTLIIDQRSSVRSLTLRSGNTILRLWLITISIRQQILISSSNINRYIHSLSRTIRISHNHLGRLLTNSRSIYRTIKLKLSTCRQITLISNTLSSISITTLSNNNGLAHRLMSRSLRGRNFERHDSNRFSVRIRNCNFDLIARLIIGTRLVVKITVIIEGCFATTLGHGRSKTTCFIGLAASVRYRHCALVRLRWSSVPGVSNR